jgi:hypothetical protein
LIDDKKFDTEDWVEGVEDDGIKRMGEEFGIISLTKHRDSILMWSHYASSHTGFCIGFKSEKIFFSKNRFGAGGVVNYTSKFPEILPSEEYFRRTMKILYTKLDIWKYEDEYRLTKYQAANKTVKFTPDEVAEIIIGCSMSKSNIDSLLNICKANLPNIPIFKTVQEKYSFKLSFERVL